MEEELKKLFESHFKRAPASVAAIRGDGSERKLFRLSGGRTAAIGAFNPDRRENRAFLGFSRHFRKFGLPVPKIYAADEENGFYLEEDLGDTTLFGFLSAGRKAERIPSKVADIYEKAVRFLPRFQIGAGKSLDYGLCYPRAGFDKQSMLWDLNYFKYYFLRLARIPLNEQALENDFRRFVQYLLAAKRDYFLYRDFQSRNIMIREGRPWFIDYQGGRKGALQYDIASLLFDAKADLPPEFRLHLLEIYLKEAGRLIPLDRAEFLKFYPGYVYIRIMQAMGTYGLRGFYERKPHFLQSIPYAVRNIEHLLRAHKMPIPAPELLRVFKSLVASSQLRQFGDASLKLTVRIQSFSYRLGLPMDDHGHGGGFVFDCRALPNPGKFARYAKMTGKDQPVIAFLEKEPSLKRFLNHARRLIDETVENYQDRNFTDLSVAFGCTGGQHRSVYCAEALARHLERKYGRINVKIAHRDAVFNGAAAAASR